MWANTPWSQSYRALSGFTFGPDVAHLQLSMSAWATDGLLTVFFFVVGLELKHEIVAGSLRNPRQAAVPILAAVGGMATPAVLFTLVILAAGDTEALRGWAIPTATDIAFALAVLAIFGRGLPRTLRTFLLTLAIVDDLLAIIVIAVFYTGTIDAPALLSSLAAVAVFAALVRMRRTRWWLLVPVAVLAWAFMHASGVHATIAGVLLGCTVPALPRQPGGEPRTHRFAGTLRPFVNGIALPVFAFFSAGVPLLDGPGPAAVLAQPVVPAIVIALVLGKLVGVLATTALVTRLTPLRLPGSIGLRDLLPVGLLAGIGFTVSLLIAELSFPDTGHTDGARIAILIATFTAATLLRRDARTAHDSDVGGNGGPGQDTAPIE